jgi:hypothetical protein
MSLPRANIASEMFIEASRQGLPGKACSDNPEDFVRIEIATA